MRLSRLGILAVVTIALGMVTAANASAIGGPVNVIVLCEKVALPTGHYLERASNGQCREKDATAEGEWETKAMVLAAGETVNIVSEGKEFVLKGTTNFGCSLETDVGTIDGGNPGTAETTMTYTGCHLEGDTVAECGISNTSTAGELLVTNVHTVLVYPESKAETISEAYVAFVPNLANTLVEFTLTGTKCALLNNIKVVALATGTEIKEPAFNKNCARLAEVGKLSGGVFTGLTATELAVVGALQSLGTPTEAELYEQGAKRFKLIECKMEAFGSGAVVGTSDVILESEEEYGWEV